MSPSARRAGLFAAAVILLIAMLAWLQVGPFARPGGEARSSQVQAAPPRALTAADEPALAAGGRFNFDAVTRVSQLDGPEARRLLPAGERLDMLRLALAVCNAFDARRKYEPLPGTPDGRRRALEFQLAAGKRFCDPPLPSSSQVWDQFMALDPRDETVTAAGLMSLEADEVDTVGVPLAEGLISTSRTASALERAGHFLILSGHDLPQLQRVPMPADAGDAQARLDLQKMALDMVACDIRGGCGPGGLQTLAWCGRHCGPGVSRQDVWRLSTPPTHYAYARRLADEIRADRRRATKR